MSLSPGSEPPLASAGELARLLTAGQLCPGDRLWRTRPDRSARPLVEVTGDGRLRAEAGAVYDGPRAAITALEHVRAAPIAWQCFTTAAGTCLETLRQRTEPDQVGARRLPGALAPLIDAGQLDAGSSLEFEMTSGRGRTGQHVRVLATAVAVVTADGWLLLPDCALYAAPSPAAAACCGMLTNGWRAWRLATDGRPIGVLRRTAGISPPHRTGRRPGPPVE